MVCDNNYYHCKHVASILIPASPPTPGRPFAIKPQSTSITIGWSESSCDGGHALSSFTIQYDKVYGFFLYRYVRNIPSAMRNYTITGLESNTLYSFRVQAVNVNSLTSSYSLAVSISTLSPGE